MPARRLRLAATVFVFLVSPWRGWGGPPAEQDRLLDLVNAQRTQGAQCGSLGKRRAVPPMLPAQILAEVAAAHARDMAENGYVDHENLRGQRVRDRARLAGYQGDVGENIAWSVGDPKAALGAWLASGGHCSNLMDPRYREAGIGVARSQGFGLVWVLVLGSRSR